MIYVCSVCAYEYDESKQAKPFSELSDDWKCPVCGVDKSHFAPREIKAEKQPTKTVADVIMQTLSTCGLKWVFGMVGHSNLGVADSLRRLALDGKLNFVGIRHEGAAAFASSAYGKLLGKPAACLSIAGPGATNLLTGVYDAKLDSAPLIALTGQVPSSELGSYAFQEIDLVRLFSDAVSSSFNLNAESRFAEIAVNVWRNSVLEKSPTQIVLPDDLQTSLSSSEIGVFDGKLVRSRFVPRPQDISSAASFISKARSPVIVVGEGCRWAMDAVLNFAERFGIAMVTTYRAKGFVSDAHKLACGVVGRSGTAVANSLIATCDLIIGLGTSFSKHSEIPRDKMILQIDCNASAFGRLRAVDFALLGEISQTLPLLQDELSKMSLSFIDRESEIAEAWNVWRAEKLKRASQSSAGAISPAAVCATLSKFVDEDAIICVDVGNVAYEFGRYFESKNQRVLLSFYLGSIGVGLPSAIGAWCATQERDGAYAGKKVVAVVGDGGLGQYLSEWTTVAKYGMDIKCVVFNNSELAKISMEQRAANVDVWETSLVNPNFAEYAKLCGTSSVRITNPEKLEEEMKTAFAKEGSALIEILTRS